MEKNIFYGIDFGTTKTSVVKIITDGENRKLFHLGGSDDYPFPSMAAVSKTTGQMLFGEKVRTNRNKLSEEFYIIHSIKSFLNRNADIIADGERFSATEITASFLAYVRESVKNKYGDEITEAAFALPADFTEHGRKNLILAAEKAGIKVILFINEPTAAYISNMDYIKKYSNIMILDWGGGTADVSLLNIQGDKIRELSVYGESCGGDDIDLRLAEYLHPKLTEEFPIDISFSDIANDSMDKILNLSEQLKIDFSESEDGEEVITLNGYCGIDSSFASMTNLTFDELVAPIIKRIVNIIKKSLEGPNVSIDSIDRVILTGGSCEIRAFRNIMNEIFTPSKVLLSESMQWAVAEGAAIINSLGGKIYLNDDICVVLSDGTAYPLLKKDESAIGCESEAFCFALTEDSRSANFIFTNSDKSINYGVKSVNTKGFLREELILKAYLDTDQSSRIEIENVNMGKDYLAKLFINKLKFYYNLERETESGTNKI